MSVDVKKLLEEAESEIAAERTAKAKKALVGAIRRRDAAQQIVRNCEAEISDLTASIEDGSFN